MRQLRILMRDQKSLKICCHPVDCIVWSVKISNVNELKRRINSEWAAMRHAVIKRAVGEWRQRLYALAFVLEEDIFSTCCNKDVM